MSGRTRSLRFLVLHVLPGDIVLLIEQHMAASAILQRVRWIFLRYTRHVRWASLRTLLLSRTTPADFELLSRNVYVRKEWGADPDAWVHMLRTRPADLLAIVGEVRAREPSWAALRSRGAIDHVFCT